MNFWCGTQFRSTTELVPTACMLDEAGYYGVYTGDHLIYPRELSSRYPYPEAALPDGRPFWAPESEFPDTWIVISAMAAATRNLHFSNAIFVAPARPILDVAKQVGTASVLSGGRVSLGVGTGWMREEFELMGQDFDTRGPRLVEMVSALRELWKGGWVSWHGKYYDIPELMMEPHPDPTVPILWGGRSDLALRRAARACDGWVGVGCAWDEAVRYVERLKDYLREYGRDNEPFEILMPIREMPTPDLYKRAEDLGITGVMVSPWSHGQAIHAVDHSSLKEPAERYREPIERFAEEIVSKCR